MNHFDGTSEIEEPAGKFIIDNLSVEKQIMTTNGVYIHYSDVCQLLNKYYVYKTEKETAKKENQTKDKEI